MSTCIHCGTRFTPSREGDEFCCKGCECVHHLIRDQGHDRFYEIRRNQTLAPVKSRPFEQPDLDWLEEKVRLAERANEPVARLDCRLEGLSCVACVWLVERLFERHAGAIRAVSNPARSSLHLEWRRGACDLAAFARELISFGYTPAPEDAAAEHRESSGLAARTGLCFAFALNAMGFTLPSYLGMPDDFAFAGLFRLIVFLSATLSMLIGGAWFIARAWRTLRAGAIHIDLPIALGLSAAYLGSLAGWISGRPELLYFDFVCTFVFLMLGGRWLQTLAVEKNRRRMARRSPIPARLRSGESEVPLEALKPDTEFELPPGQALPVAAALVSGQAEVSYEWIHGEPDPVPVAAGTILPAGAILLSRRPATLRARETWRDSLLSRLSAESEAERGSPALQRLLRGYLIAVIAIGLAGFAYWSWHGETITALQVMISIFVVSCPCALGVAIPLADERAAKLAARAGAFVRRASLWPRLLQIRQLVFDKTGTLTLERPVLEEPQRLKKLDATAATALALLTSGSRHPLSRSLLEALGAHGQELLGRLDRPPAIVESPGQGVSVRIGADEWSLGKPGWQADGEAGTTVLAKNGTATMAFRFRDQLRPGTAATMRWLARRGLGIHILSGDHPDKVAALAGALGLDPERAHGGLSPDDKAARLQALDRGDSLYFGDGANDSLAFDHAHLAGTPVADHSLLERKADFFTLGDGLGWLPELFAIARARSAGIRRAFTFAIAYNLAAIVLCLGGLMNPLLAAVLMPISSIVSLLLVGSAKLAVPGKRVQADGENERPPWRTPKHLPNASTSAC